MRGGFKADVLLRLAIDSGDGQGEKEISLTLSKAELKGKSVDQLATLLGTRINAEVTGATVGVDTFTSLPSFSSPLLRKGLRITVTPDAGAVPASIRVLAPGSLTDSVLVGKDAKGNSILQRIEKIVAANADNTFLFGSNWGQIKAGTVRSGLGNLFGDYISNAIPNQKNRVLEIDTRLASESGKDLVLDFRAVDESLSFTFSPNGEGGANLLIERVESLSIPTLNLPFPALSFNKIIVSNVDENTILYGGRTANTYAAQNGALFKGFVVGGTGLKSGIFDSLADVVGIGVDLFGGGNIPEFTVGNTVALGDISAGPGTRNTFFETVNAKLGGTGPFSFLPFVGGPPVIPGFVDGHVINVADAHHGGFISSVVGTNLGFGTLENEFSIGPFKTGPHFPDDAQQFVKKFTTALGSNTLSFGQGSLLDQILGNFPALSLSDVPALLASALVPSFHFASGLTGSDTYSFAGPWGVSLILEPPSLTVASGDTNFFPDSFDTLDVSGVEQDMHFTILELEVGSQGFFKDFIGKLPGVGSSGGDSDGFNFGIGTNIVIATPFAPPTEFDDTGDFFKQLGENILASIVDRAKGFFDFSSGFTGLDSILGLDFLKLDGGIIIANDIENILGWRGHQHLPLIR